MNPAAAQMPLLGLLTGVSYVSGIDYFRGINEQVAEAVPREQCCRMKKNARLVMACVDCDTYVDQLESKNDEGVVRYLIEDGVQRLVAGGAQVLVICSNTAHMCVPAVELQFPQLQILHIADTTAVAAVEAGCKTVGLLGTEPTMRDGSWLKSRLASHGLMVVVPSEVATLRRLYDIICQELSFNILKPESREFIVQCATELAANGAEAVILGCTELELLVHAEHVPTVRLLPSAALHIAAAARVATGTATVADYAPPEAI